MTATIPRHIASVATTITVVLALITLLFTGCAHAPGGGTADTGVPLRLETLDDPNGQSEAMSRAFGAGWQDDLVLFEDFNDTEVEGLSGVDEASLEDGVLRVAGNNEHLSFESEAGFTRIVVCYRVESERGHLFIPVHTPDGHFALFNDVNGDWAWTDFEDGHQRIEESGFGSPEASNRGTWMLHELRLEEGRLSYYVNTELFGSVALEDTELLHRFSVTANEGGRGVVDYVLVGGGPAAAASPTGSDQSAGGSDSAIPRGEPIGLEGWEVEVVVPAPETAPAPFDSTVTADGEILMSGARGRMVGYTQDGFEELAAPAGTNFEVTSTGAIWYYDFPTGALSRWTPDRGREELAQLPEAYTDGSLAVAPDGKTAYIAWWIRDADPTKEASALYRYVDGGALEKLFDMPEGVFLRAVEVSPEGRVYLATSEGIDRLEGTSRAPVYRRPEIYIRSDALTSDAEGNLYFSAYTDGGAGVYRLDPGGTAELISRNPEGALLPFGLSWDERERRVIGVRKESGELVAVDMDGSISVLNAPSGLITPIAVEESSDGELLVNGDEVGLLRITEDGTVTRFAAGITSYQPPAADFAIAADRSIYYSEAAPGFTNRIIRIDPAGERTVLTRDVGAPAGIDVAPDGRVFYADYAHDAVYELEPDGSSRLVEDGIPSPVGLKVGPQGRIWVGSASAEDRRNPRALGEIVNSRILRFAPGEAPEIVFEADPGRSISFFDIDEAGALYVPDGSRLLRRDPSGDIDVIVRGFVNARGAAVTAGGGIVVTDYGVSALYTVR